MLPMVAMGISSLKYRHVGCLSRGLGVARSAVKSMSYFEVPERRKSPKTLKNSTGISGWVINHLVRRISGINFSTLNGNYITVLTFSILGGVVCYYCVKFAIH